MDKYHKSDIYNLIVVGSLDARKSVGIFLEALSKIKRKSMIHVNIVGDGPLRSSLEQYSRDNNLASMITWHGQLPRETAIELFDKSHLLVLTSVSEGNPTEIWESMSYGVPTMSYDHCVMHDKWRDGAGVLVSIKPPYQACVQAVTDSIDYSLDNPEEFLKLATATIERAKEYNWVNRRAYLNEIYDKLLGLN